ncbi:MAG TPA: protein-L-isoaspartate(D-aspartate) O-methyltransferase [Solirubrobacterales bacterium]|nr:protein-L-isoaspartate(D-aspartate) O-methyltransferase [Solirubrobacterales bacterium]
MADFGSQRARMVERQLRRRGIGDDRVLAAMNRIPRDLFVPERHRRRSYADSALPIAEGQTISQPWIVAAIAQALEPKGNERVLEIGTGSGYSTCILAELAAEVFSIERHEPLGATAREAIQALGYENVQVVVGDGSRGLPERAPFDGIAVHATAPAPPPSLLAQLADGGRLVAPIASDAADLLTVFRRVEDDFESRVIGPCRFVPLIGAEGFGEPG